jgi:hypothetical protein
MQPIQTLPIEHGKRTTPVVLPGSLNSTILVVSTAAMSVKRGEPKSLLVSSSCGLSGYFQEAIRSVVSRSRVLSDEQVRGLMWKMMCQIA